MRPDIAQTWTDDLTPEQLGKLQWLKDRKCIVEATFAAPDPLHDLPAGVVLEVVMDKHAVVKIRGTDIPGLFEHAYNAAIDLFNYVNQHVNRPERRL